MNRDEQMIYNFIRSGVAGITLRGGIADISRHRGGGLIPMPEIKVLNIPKPDNTKLEFEKAPEITQEEIDSLNEILYAIGNERAAHVRKSFLENIGFNVKFAYTTPIKHPDYPPIGLFLKDGSLFVTFGHVISATVDKNEQRTSVYLLTIGNNIQ